MGEPTMTVTVDAELLRVLRATLVRRLEARMRPTLANGNVSGFEAPVFVKKFGVALENVSDKVLLTLALVEAIQKVDAAPAGTCGYDYFDA